MHSTLPKDTRMKITHIILITALAIGYASCNVHNNKNMEEQNNPLMCNPESGLCEIPTLASNPTDSVLEKADKKPIKIIYYTDPICSSCWGIEPQLRKLKLEYGNHLEIEYRMGGLLPNWSYNSGGISKPSDVAHHWDEVSIYYDMPIDGNVWLEDPLDSSYPPSIAFKAAQIQDQEKAILFLREIREMVFLEKKNITKWENLAAAAKTVGLDLEKFKTDYEGQAQQHFETDLKLGRDLGVRGFPTIFFTDSAGNQEKVYGSQPYSTFESTLLQLLPTVTKTSYDKTWQGVFSKYHSLTAREYSELTNTPRSQSEAILDSLTKSGHLTKLSTKKGHLWTLVISDF